MEPYLKQIIIMAGIIVIILIIQMFQICFVFSDRMERTLDNSIALLVVLIIFILGFRFMEYLETLNTFLI